MQRYYTPCRSWDMAKRTVMAMNLRGYTSEIMALDGGGFEVVSWK